MPNNSLEDPTLPSEIITRKAESLGIDRKTFQTIYPQIQQKLGNLNDAQLAIALDNMVRDQRDQPQAQVKQAQTQQADLNRAIPWADQINEAYGTKALDEYHSKIKDWEQKSGMRRSASDIFAGLADIDTGGKTDFLGKNKEAFDEEKSRIARDTIGMQGAKQKLLADKTTQINSSRDSSQKGLENLASNTGLSLKLSELDPNSPISRNYQKIAKGILPEFSEDDLASMPAGLVQQFIAFKQAQGKLSSEQLKLLSEVGKNQAEAGKAGAESDKARAEASNVRQFTDNIKNQGSNPDGLLVQTGPQSLTVNPVVAEAGKQNIGIEQKNSILQQQINNIKKVIKNAKDGKIDFGKLQFGTDPSLGGYKPNIVNNPQRVAANEEADNIMVGENFVQALQQGGRGLSDTESKGIKDTFPTRTLAKDEYIARSQRLLDKLLIEQQYNLEKIDKKAKPKDETKSSQNLQKITTKDGRKLVVDRSNNNKVMGTW